MYYDILINNHLVFPANPGSVTVGSDGVTYASEFIMVQLTPDPAVVSLSIII